MADRLDAMTVGILHEGAVIVGVIVRPKPWRTIVAPPAGKRSRVKGVDRRAVRSAETDMCASMGVLTSASQVMVNSTPGDPGAAP